MNQSEKVRQQFNRQAQAFGDWAVTRNVAYLEAIADFVGLGSGDSLLDVATGTGEFALFVAPRVRAVVGIDVSDKMIEIAVKQARSRGIANAEFRVADVAHLPVADNAHDVVFCKSAFHHFGQPEAVFRDMVRCCKPGGRLGICDIVAFDDPGVDRFFEELEKAVDPSHYQTLSRHGFAGLYGSNGIKVDKTFEVEIEHDIAEDLTHAVRSREDEARIDSLINRARSDAAIGAFWTLGQGREGTKFRKKVILLLGTR
jgi:ubiquinone/menaquinone biosynthesis C-methylase UbiE